MKMTMHIDDKLLDEVIERFGCASKTEAVDFALREVLRKAKLRELGRTGLGLTADELGNAVYPDYDVVALRVAEKPMVKYGKRGSRR
jgi:Arc/MetJ family transcription regulator